MFWNLKNVQVLGIVSLGNLRIGRGACLGPVRGEIFTIWGLELTFLSGILEFHVE